MFDFQYYKYVQLSYHTLNSICYACLILVKNNDLESINLIQISSVMRALFFCKIFTHSLGSSNKMKSKGCLLQVMINGIHLASHWNTVKTGIDQYNALLKYMTTKYGQMNHQIYIFIFVLKEFPTCKCTVHMFTML